MMREDIRQVRVKIYGSFLYCPDRDTLCFAMDNEYGICERGICCLDDPEYQALQRRQKYNQKKNEERKRKEAEEERLARKNIKNQSGCVNRAKQDQIQELEERSRQLYRQNKPDLAETAFLKAQILRGQSQK